MLESAAALVDEHADLEQQLADPAVFGDQDLVRRLNKRYAALAPDRRGLPRVARGRPTTSRPPASSPRRTRTFAAEVPSLEAASQAAEDKLRRLLVPARPRRRPRRHPRGQGGRGRRGVGAVRRRPAADVPAVRRAARAGRPS